MNEKEFAKAIVETIFGVIKENIPEDKNKKLDEMSSTANQIGDCLVKAKSVPVELVEKYNTLSKELFPLRQDKTEEPAEKHSPKEIKVCPCQCSTDDDDEDTEYVHCEDAFFKAELGDWKVWSSGEDLVVTHTLMDGDVMCIKAKPVDEEEDDG